MIQTKRDLYLKFQSSPDTDLRDWWLGNEKENWKGKEKQESTCKLFASLGTIRKLKDFQICTGNFNKGTIKPITSNREIFYNSKNKEICLNDKGDASDLTGIHKKDDKLMMVSTSKCLNNMSIRKLDIDYIAREFQQYEKKGYRMQLCIIVKDAKEFYNKLEKTEKTTSKLKDYIKEHNPIIIDWLDLNEAYHEFKKIFGNITFEDLIKSRKSPFCLRLHQKLCILKTMSMKKETKNILFGQIQRSGKSFMVGGVIVEDSKEKPTCNYLIITTAPNETICQFLEVFDSSQFEDFNIVVADGKNSKPMLKNKNIIICSKQFLQNKIEEGDDPKNTTRTISWLKKMMFDMRFVDESHNGGTTELAKNTLNVYGKNVFTIYITATYYKPTKNYNIPREHWILWDLEDIHLCKNIDKESSVNRLIEKHGDELKTLLSEYSKETILSDFSKYPDLDILTREINPTILTQILKETENNPYGWSLDACFTLKQGIDTNGNIIFGKEFQNEREILKLWYSIFGKRGQFGIPDSDYPDETVFMKRIEKICKNPMTASRFDKDINIIMAFLPSKNIDIISNATKDLLERENVLPEYNIISINSHTTIDPKQTILDAKIRAKHHGKKGVLVLSGRQCSLGITIEDCDIVLMLNNSKSYDLVFQMMFRCMTEGEGKRRGFVIDLNIHRVIETILMEYGANIKPYSHPKEAIQYLLEEKLINLNSDHWNPCFGHDLTKLTKYTEMIYDVYSSKMSGVLENLFRKMSFKQELFSKNDYEIMCNIFENVSNTKETKHIVLGDTEEMQTKKKLKKGMGKTPIQKTELFFSDLETNEPQLDPIDILRPISIIISLLTIHHDEKTTLEEMFSFIEENPTYKFILLNQVRVWWGKGVSTKNVENLIRIFQIYLEKDTQTTMLIRQVKELFCKNIKNSKELSKIIDKYLIPLENEKKKNAEVSTPRPSRQEMLDLMPKEFWEEKRRVFEPCCGKGGFLLDIMDRFMEGMKKTIQNEKTRYKKIVEECLYFSDINEMNIFICRILLDPYDEYSLNFNTGNTLELNIKEKWGIESFDAIIGNPPYQDCNATGDNKLYLEFIKFSIDILKDNMYLLFIVPLNIKNYITNQEKNRPYFRNFYDIKYLALNTPNVYFPSINTYFSYFLLQKRIVEKCNVKVSYVRKGKIEVSNIVLHEKDNLPLCLSDIDFRIINKVSNLIKKNWETFPIQKALYQKESKYVSQRIRSTHLSKGYIKKTQDEEFRHIIIDKINKSHPFPGIFYYYDRKMTDFGKPKVIMSTGGYLMPSFDEKGIYNLSDNMIYMLVKNKEEYEGLTLLIESNLIRYLNKITMTDNIHGRDKVIANMKMINLSNIKKPEDIYNLFDLKQEEIMIIQNTI